MLDMILDERRNEVVTVIVTLWNEINSHQNIRPGILKQKLNLVPCPAVVKRATQESYLPTKAYTFLGAGHRTRRSKLKYGYLTGYIVAVVACNVAVNKIVVTCLPMIGRAFV